MSLRGESGGVQGMGRRGRTGPGGAVVSSLSDKSGGVIRPSGAAGSGASASASSSSSVPSVSSGWVGKQPSNFVREWCSKHGRRRPLFKDVKSQPGFVRCVIPQGTKKPKEEVEIVAVGDRPGMEWAALSMLHQIEKGRQLHRILPPEFAEHWHKMEKRAEAESRASERRAFQQAKQDKRGKAAAKKDVSDSKCDEVTLSARSRTAIENVLLSLRAGSPSTATPVTGEAIAELVQLGFNHADAKIALGNQADDLDSVTSAIDYLCLNLQEDELPAQFAPKADIEVVTHSDEVTSAVDWKLCARLADVFATSRSAAERALRNTGGNDRLAAKNLYNGIVYQGSPTISTEEVTEVSAECAADQKDELEALQAIYGDQDVAGADCLDGVRGWTLQICLRKLRCVGGLDVSLVLLDADRQYPQSVPIVYLKARGDGIKISPQIRRAIIRAAAAEAAQVRKDMDSEPMPLAHHLVAHLSELSVKQLADEGSMRREYPNFKNSSLKAPSEPLTEELSRPGSKQRKTRLHKGALVSPIDLNNIDPAMRAVRLNLPAWSSRVAIQNAVRNESMVVICGETGSGKTTQVPQYLLDDPKRGGLTSIICTQPRRLAAIAVAERVATERGEKVGQTVGYQVKLDSKTSKDTALTFCTTGVLLRRIQQDNNLLAATHIIVDEVHERSIETDFLLVLLRRLVEKRKDLRVLLMSATLNAQKFAAYFGRSFRDPPIITIPGRTFPVEQRYLETVLQQTGYTVSLGSEYSKKRNDLDKSTFDGTLSPADLTYRIIRDDIVNNPLIECLVNNIDETFEDCGAILVFLPGVADILNLVDRLSKSKSLLVLPLHANLSSQEQSRIFRAAPKGRRKVICSTNVAETSITVDDVVVVIDTCRAKEAGFDAMTGAATLTEVFISKANCKQRSGRAGRVRPGICFRMVRDKTFSKKLKDEHVPEICRTPLERMILTAIASGFSDPRRLLSEAVDPPPPEAVDAGTELLMGLGALTYDGQTRCFALTGLGRHLASFPIDVRLGKLLVLGAIFRCIDPILTIAAAANEKPMFYSPSDRRDDARKAKEQFAWGRSDLLTQARAFDSWRKIRDAGRAGDSKFCADNFIARKAVIAIFETRRQLMFALSDAGLGGNAVGWEQSDKYNCNSSNLKVLKAVILGSLYPNLVQIRAPDSQYVPVAGGAVAKDNDDPRNVRYFTRDKMRLFLHPDSINFSEVKYNSNWAAFLGMWKNETKTFVRDCNEVTAGGLLLFAGGDMVVQHEKGLVLLDGWIRLKSKARTAVLARELRQHLDSSLTERYVSASSNPSDGPLLEAFLLLLEEN